MGNLSLPLSSCNSGKSEPHTMLGSTEELALLASFVGDLTLTVSMGMLDLPISY